jgi:alkanesulfonate monooxygenase
MSRGEGQARGDCRVLAQRQAAFAGTPMVGQQAQLQQRLRERAPRLWNGISRVRVNLGTAIVGDPGQVAAELLAYWRLGIDEFILSGYPHPEECRRVASDVLPGLRTAIERERGARGRSPSPPPGTSDPSGWIRRRTQMSPTAKMP